MVEETWHSPLQPAPDFGFLGVFIGHFGHDSNAVMNVMVAQLDHMKQELKRSGTISSDDLIEHVVHLDNRLKHLMSLFDVVMNAGWSRSYGLGSASLVPLADFTFLGKIQHYIQFFGKEDVSWHKIPIGHNAVDLFLYALAAVTNRRPVKIRCHFEETKERMLLNMEFHEPDNFYKQTREFEDLQETLVTGAAHFGFKLELSQLESSGRATIEFAIKDGIGGSR